MNENGTAQDSTPTTPIDKVEPIGASDAPTTPIPLPATTVTSPADESALAGFWGALKHLPQYVRLTAEVVRDPRVPKQAKASLAVGGGYVASPLDLVPGFIPVAGQLDDLYVLLTALQLAVKLTPDDVMTPHLMKVGLSAADIDRDLAAIRRLVQVAVVKGLKLGGAAVTRAAAGITTFIRSRQAQRKEVAGE